MPPERGRAPRSTQRARQLGRELKLPGFRRGKVPAPLVMQRVGREAVLEEAVRESLSSWYSDAIDEPPASCRSATPRSTSASCPPQGQALEFSIEIGVLPKAKLGDYRGLEVAAPRAGRRRAAARARDRGAARAPGPPADGRARRRGRRLRRHRLRRAAAARAQPRRSRRPFEGGEGRDQLSSSAPAT